MELSVLFPLLVVIALPVLVPPNWRDDDRTRARWECVLVACLAVLVLRYLWWRFFVTVLPAQELSANAVFVWTLFLIEMIAWVDAAILFMALLRRRNRSPEADGHERRLRGMSDTDLPDVDIFIATYNEPQEVLEKTIIGATNLDWPRERLHVHVLDDGKRDWLREFCARVGVNHMTRPDNSHAKAGNINAAIKRTSSPFFLVLDADFVPQRPFLYRAIGFFEDPRVGIVQIPHNFFNNDPMQANLGLQAVLPDDQRLFFDAIMPGRDGWDAAFCCGSNALTRRSAMEAVGGGLPTGSITEDMLLTLALLRKGYVTRYLNERLAIGLAPESLSAFFVQRARWARGAIQILYLKEGPLGPGLKLHHRLLFLPTHWLTQSLCQVAAMCTPAIYLWTGLLPLMNADLGSVLQFQIPAVLATLTILRMLAPGQFFPLANTAHGTLQAFRLLPTILHTLVKPTGHAFKVTPKGSANGNAEHTDRFTLVTAVCIMAFTAAGLFLNSSYNTQIVEFGALVPIVAFWAVYNMVVLSVVAALATTQAPLRSEERFPLEEECILHLKSERYVTKTRNLSLGGVEVRNVDVPSLRPLAFGDWIVIELAGVGRLAVEVRRKTAKSIAFAFGPMPESKRHALIRRLFTEGVDNSTRNEAGLALALHLIRSAILRKTGAKRQPLAQSARQAPPAWIAQTEKET